jgi:hypothetical protein
VEELREYPKWIAPHSEFGDPECCGLLFPVVVGTGPDGHLLCNECGATSHRMPAEELTRKIAEMECEFAKESGGTVCPFCGKVNERPGFSQLFALVCYGCGKGVGIVADLAPPG